MEALYNQVSWRHHAKQGTQFGAGKVSDIVAVHQDGAIIDIIEPHKQFDHGGFTGASRADNGHLLARFDHSAEVIDDGFIRRISKVNMSKLYTAVNMYVHFCTGTESSRLM